VSISCSLYRQTAHFNEQASQLGGQILVMALCTSRIVMCVQSVSHFISERFICLIASDSQRRWHSRFSACWVDGGNTLPRPKRNSVHFHMCVIRQPFIYGNFSHIYAVLTGVFILLSTTARSSNALLGWNCGNSFASNVMYGVLYAMTPELFPTKNRGTGNALVATANRIFGVMVSVYIVDSVAT
jgi:hypothetical protein